MVHSLFNEVIVTTEVKTDSTTGSWQPRTRRSSGLQGKILESAQAILTAEGIANLSMRKIAADIGCKAPSIYYHFKNKDALIHALIDEGHRLLHQDLVDALREDVSPLDNLETNLRTFITFCLDNPLYYEIMYLMRSSEVSTYPKELFRKARRAAEPSDLIMKQCQELGLICPGDLTIPAAATRVMLHGFVAIVLTRRFDRRIDQDQVLEHTMDRILLGLGIGGSRGNRYPIQVTARETEGKSPQL